MRYLIVDSNYPPFLTSVYGAQPELASQPYATQLAAIHDGLFGEAAFQAEALRRLGHEAEVVIANAYPAQRAWAREHDLRLPPSTILRPVLRRGLVPWLRRIPSSGYTWTPVLAQVAHFRPDVVQVQCVDMMPAEIARAIRAETRLVVGQLAAPPPPWKIEGIDLMISSLPNLVQSFRDQGLRAEWVPLAFEPSILERVPAAARDIGVSFIGSLSAYHASRIELLHEVARRTPLQIWTADRSNPGVQGLPATLHAAVWGRRMYETLARSVSTINTHIDIAGDFANNLRLYEATGMGALLVTDAKRNLGQLFEAGREVVAYRDARECADMLAYYLDHPEEAASIARAGQQRTLRDHTWLDRMARVADLTRRLV
jgi:spore maturation protein CgeB